MRYNSLKPLFCEKGVKKKFWSDKILPCSLAHLLFKTSSENFQVHVYQNNICFDHFIYLTNCLINNVLMHLLAGTLISRTPNFLKFSTFAFWFKHFIFTPDFLKIPITWNNFSLWSSKNEVLLHVPQFYFENLWPLFYISSPKRTQYICNLLRISISINIVRAGGRLDTNFDTSGVQSSTFPLIARLISFECFHEHNMSVFLCAKFDWKAVLNEEIPVNKWQKKIKHVELGRNDVYSDHKELKFWVRFKCSLW